MENLKKCYILCKFGYALIVKPLPTSMNINRCSPKKLHTVGLI